MEEKGFKWLKRKVSNRELSVCKADKGGAILLVPPEFLKRKIEEKVLDPDCYKQETNDPSRSSYDDLIKLWKFAQKENFISDIEAKKLLA